MSTRSNIGIRETDGTVKTIYCHWDGYPQYVGRLLLTYYTTEQDVRGLLDLGDISELKPTLSEVVAYHRDRGEPKADVHTFAPGSRVRENDFAYVYDVAESRWYWCEDSELNVLTQEDVK
jgi:hypothetical protein